MAFVPETDCLITDLLELENITFEMIPYGSFDSSLIYLPGGHIFKVAGATWVVKELCSLSLPHGLHLPSPDPKIRGCLCSALSELFHSVLI